MASTPVFSIRATPDEQLLIKDLLAFAREPGGYENLQQFISRPAFSDDGYPATLVNHEHRISRLEACLSTPMLPLDEDQ